MSQVPPVLPWLDAFSDALLASGIGRSILEHRGISLIEVLRSALYVELMAIGRSGSRDPEPSLYRRLGHRFRRASKGVGAAVRSSGSLATDVLFWPREPTHLRQQLPVSQVLQTRGVSTGFATMAASVFERLRALNVSPAFAPWLFPMVAIRGLAQGLRRRSGLLSALDGDLHFTSANDPAWVHGMLCTLRKQLPAAMVALETSGAVLEKLEPKVVVIGNDITLEGRAMAFMARSVGVPTVTLMHGMGTGNPLLGYSVADRILVFGNTQRRYLESRGVSQSRIEVVGAPYLDRMPRQTGRTDPQLRQLLGLPQDGRWVLVATSGAGHRVSADHHRAFITALDRTARRLDNLTFVVKLHRKDNPALCADCRSVLVAPKNAGPVDIQSWLQGCSAVVTTGSTVGTEAMLLDVPVVTVDLQDELHGVDFIDATATLHATDLEGFVRSVESAVGLAERPAAFEERVASYLDDRFFARRGGASDNAADVIEGLLGHS